MSVLLLTITLTGHYNAIILSGATDIHLWRVGIESECTSFAVDLRGASAVRYRCAIHHTIRRVIRLSAVAVISHPINSAIDRHPIGIRLYLNRIGHLEQSLTIQAIGSVARDIALFKEGKQ